MREIQYKAKGRINTIDKKTGKTKGEIILEYCSVSRTRVEIQNLLGVQIDMLRLYIVPLLESGKLQMTIPEHPMSKNQRFIAFPNI